MSYTKHTWSGEESITNAKMNNIESGIEEAMQSGGGYDAEIHILQPISGTYTYTIISGSYENLVSLVEEGVAPNILVRCWDEGSSRGWCSSIVTLDYYNSGYTVPNMVFCCKGIQLANANNFESWWFSWDANDEVGYWD